MTNQHALYEVWFSFGQGLQIGPRFRLLADARRYIESHRTEASHAIRSPTGKWESFARRAPEQPQPPRTPARGTTPG